MVKGGVSDTKISYPRPENLLDGNLQEPYTVGDRVEHRSVGKPARVTAMKFAYGTPSGYAVDVEYDDGFKAYGMSAETYWPVDVGVRRHNFSIKINQTVKTSINHWPHKCPNCKGEAFVGFNTIECRSGGCFKKESK